MWAGRTKSRRGENGPRETPVQSHVEGQRVHTADGRVEIGVSAPTPMCHCTTVHPDFETASRSFLSH